MLERDGYIAGVPCWVDTSQPDPAAAVAFYRDLFGWEFEDVMPPGAPGAYYMARLHGGDVAAVGSQSDDGPSAATWNTYIWVDSAEATAKAVQAAGGRVISPPFDVGDAGRMAVCADLEDAVFCLWEAKRHRGARIVNEPGSLNFNGLNTHDPERAKAFYSQVFGWETLPMGAGAEAWRLPGYGAFLEQSDPGLRERMAQAGAPEGFADVVATLMPLPEGHGGVPAHWSVTFAVEDADAVATTAAALGAEVIAPPFDAPWVRMTIITDPQGATFIASKFVPENRDLVSPAGSTAQTA